MKVRKAIRALINPWRAYREKIEAIHELLGQFNKTQYRLDRVSEERDELKRQLDNSAAFQFYEPGHFYSPVPSKRDVREHLAKLERQPAHELPAIAFNDQLQLDLLDALRPYYGRIPFQAQPAEGCSIISTIRITPRGRDYSVLHAEPPASPAGHRDRIGILHLRDSGY
jgi:hypothetical protein